MRLLVTGAGGAIGSAIAEMAYENGHSVIAQDLDDQALENLPQGVERISGDLNARSGREAVISACGERLDGVVAAHGVPGMAAVAELNFEFMRRVMRVNAATIPRLFEDLRAPLERAQGAYVAIASQAALRGEPAGSTYCASKWAVRGWVEAIAPSMAESGISVRAICPGRTDSPLLRKAQADSASAEGLNYEEFVRDRLTEIPMGRVAEPAEIASACLWLADGGAPRPTVLAVTGGEVRF